MSDRLAGGAVAVAERPLVTDAPGRAGDGRGGERHGLAGVDGLRVVERHGERVGVHRERAGLVGVLVTLRPRRDDCRSLLAVGGIGANGGGSGVVAVGVSGEFDGAGVEGREVGGHGVDVAGDGCIHSHLVARRDGAIPVGRVRKAHRLDDGRVLGAAAYDMDDGHLILFEADTVVLAAGGYTSVFSRHSSRDDENTGDGPALAYEAGARLMDMEFVQFHPTGMAVDETDPEWAPWAGRLVTEAVRGEGGRLLNADGERFMEEYSPDQMELDARDVVARAIAQELREGRGTGNGGVYLDISHRDDDYIKSRLPRMYERFMDLGVDITEEPMEVAPTAHYSMGGVDIDFDTGETGVSGLYAVGETVAGVHGANRLGGNSLAETVAIGALVGDHVAAQVTGDDRDDALPAGQRAIAEREFRSLQELAASDGDETPEGLLADLGDLLWEHAGILRNEESLSTGLEELHELRERTGNIGVDGDRTSLSFELAVDLFFSLTVAEALLLSAHKRDESRGAHYRTDAPSVDPEWRRNILVDRGDTGLELTTRGVAEPSDEVSEAVDVGYELDYHHLE